MCISQLLNLIVFVLFQVAAPWTTCLDEDLQPRLMSWAGASAILSNILVAIGSGYYGSRVLNDYQTLSGLYNRDRQFTNFGSGGTVDFNGETMIFGGALYSCWVSVIFGLAAGITILCGACNDSEYDDCDDEGYNPNYNNGPNSTFHNTMQNSMIGRQSSLPHGHVNKGYEMRMQPQPYV